MFFPAPCILFLRNEFQRISELGPPKKPKGRQFDCSASAVLFRFVFAATPVYNPPFAFLKVATTKMGTASDKCRILYHQTELELDS
jgi:hypothetical protein